MVSVRRSQQGWGGRGAAVRPTRPGLGMLLLAVYATGLSLAFWLSDAADAAREPDDGAFLAGVARAASGTAQGGEKIPAGVRIIAQADTSDAIVPPVKRTRPQTPKDIDASPAAEPAAQPAEPAPAAPVPPTAQSDGGSQQPAQPSAAPPASAADEGQSATAPDAGQGWLPRLGGVLESVKDWLASSNREYQGTIVKELSAPDPQSDEAQRRLAEDEARAREAQRAQAAAEEERRRKEQAEAAARQAAEMAARDKAAREEAAREKAAAEQAAKASGDVAAAADAARKAAEAKTRADAEKAEAERTASAEAIEAERLREAARRAEEQRSAQEAARKEAQERRAREAQQRQDRQKAEAETAEARSRARSERARTDESSGRKRSGDLVHRRWAVTITPEPIERPRGADRDTTAAYRGGEDGGVLVGARRLSGRMSLGAGHARGAQVKKWVMRRGHCRLAGRKVKPLKRYTVARGDSLWRISVKHYDTGRKYKRIYRANAGRIADPDLIYPCQRFKIPRG